MDNLYGCLLFFWGFHVFLWSHSRLCINTYELVLSNLFSEVHAAYIYQGYPPECRVVSFSRHSVEYICRLILISFPGLLFLGRKCLRLTGYEWISFPLIHSRSIGSLIYKERPGDFRYSTYICSQVNSFVHVFTRRFRLGYHGVFLLFCSFFDFLKRAIGSNYLYIITGVCTHRN